MDGTAVALGVIGLVLSAATIFAIYYGPVSALSWDYFRLARDPGRICVSMPDPSWSC